MYKGNHDHKVIAEYIVANPDLGLKQVAANCDVPLTTVYVAVRKWIQFKPVWKVREVASDAPVSDSTPMI